MANNVIAITSAGFPNIGAINSLMVYFLFAGVFFGGDILYLYLVQENLFFPSTCIRLFFERKRACPFFYLVFFCLIPFFFCSCSESVESEVDLFPAQEDLFVLFPNDLAQGDSARAYFSTGVMLLVHPNGVYEISFDQDPGHEPPKLHLFRTYTKPSMSQRFGLSKIKRLKPKSSGGRNVYTFVCEEKESAFWVMTLEEDGDFYTGKTSNILFTGSGSYSDTLSLNLITVGLIDPIEGTVSVDSLSRLLVQGFRKSYASIVIDTIYTNHAEDHPTLGYAGKSSEDFTVSELGGWPAKGVANALDIVLVHRIEDLNVLGYGGLFSMNLGGGENSTVVVGTEVLTSSGIRTLGAEEIVNVAIHETGHFFGLRHTTSTRQDMEGYLDWSIVEDGFSDTPYCPELIWSGLYKVGEKGKSAMMDARAYGFEFDVAKCPDADLLMFPVSTPGTDKNFSKEQQRFLKQSLMLIPH